MSLIISLPSERQGDSDSSFNSLSFKPVYLNVDEFLTDCTNVPYNAGWLKPLKKGKITSTIGMRWGSYHNALDIGGNAEGTPIYAAAAGTVSGFVSRYKCGGNMLYINVTVGGEKYTT